MAEEESDASHLVDKERSEDTYWPVWARTYRDAWRLLRDDRFYGSMGGMGRIYYTALSQYAEDHGIPLYPFITYVRALDDVFIEWNAKEAERLRQQNKTS